MAFNLPALLSVALNTASLKNAANTINSQLKDVGAVSLGIPKNDADNLRYIKVQAAEASTAMEQFGRQSGLAAKRFVAFTLTAGAIITFTSSLKQALTAAVEFDREMVRLTQVSTDSVGQVGAVGNEVSRLSKNYGVSSKDLLTTAVTLKQANLSLADTKVALEALAQAALAPSFDNLRDTTEGAIAVMNQFGISAKDLGNALGAINAVAAEFAVEAQDLIEGVRKAGGAFKSAGGDLNEFLALFTSIRQTTRESAESIGTGLRTIFTRVQRNETVEALKDIGVQLRYTADEARAAGDLGLANQFVGPYEAVKRLSGALNELRSTDPRFSAIIEELGGYRQISKVIPLIQEFGVAQKALGIAQIGGASLALNAAQAQEAFGVKIQKVKEEFADFIRNLTNTSSFRSLIDLLLGAASAGIALADSLKGILPVITAIAAVKTVQSLTSFTKGFASTAFAPAPASQPSTFSPFLPTGGRKASGGIIKMAKGGIVPGVGRGDKVPALLEPGELVIPRNRFDMGGKVLDVIKETGKTSLNDLYDPELDAYKFIGQIKRNKLGKYDKYRKDSERMLNAGKNVYENEMANPKSTPQKAVEKANSAVTKAFGRKVVGGRDNFLGQLGENYFKVKIGEGSQSQYNQIAGALGEADTAKKLRRNPQTSNYVKLPNQQGMDFIGDDKLIETKVTKNQVPDIEIIAKALLYEGKLANINPKSSYKNQRDDSINLSNLSVYESFEKKLALGGLVPGVGNTDSVPLDLPIGSYVIKKSSVNSIGASNLSRLGRASGGVIPSLVMPGEYIYTPDETKKIGVPNLDHMNTTGRKKFARGGYGSLTKEEIKIAKQVEGQLRIPTNKAEKRQNRQEAIAVAEDVTNTTKQVKALEPIYKQQANKVAQGQKNEENINAARAEILKTMEERKGILKDVKAKEQEERDIQARHISNAKAKEQEIRGLETQKRGVAVGSREEKAIDKKIQAATRVKTNYENLAANKQASIDAAASTTAEAQKNVGQSVNNLKQVNQSAARNKAFVDQAQKDLEKTGSEINALKNKYKDNPDGNITKDGKVITSTYGDAYKKEIRKELSNYKKLYGEEATGGTRKEIRENTAQRLKAGYFNQIKSFSEAKGLEFDEKFANKQAQQMARETVAGRRKFEVSSKGEFYDPVLANRLKTQGYTETGQKKILRKVTDFGKGLVSKEGLQNSSFAVSSGIGLIASAVGPQAEDYKKAVAGGAEGESIVKAGAGISGGLTGAATGLAIGSFAGPFGMAVGALIGGFTGIVSGLTDAKKQISSIKLEEAGNKLKNAFEVAAASFGKISQENLNEITTLQSKIDDEISTKSAASTTFFSRKSYASQEATNTAVERRNQYAAQAGGINALLSKQLQEDIKSSPVVRDEQGKRKPYEIEGFFKDSANISQIARLAIGLDQPISKIKKQLETFAKDFEKQQNAAKSQAQAIEGAQKLSIAFSLIADASTNAANTLNNLTPAFQTITDSLSSNFSVSQKQKISNEIQLPSIDPTGFKTNLKNITGGLGSSGENLQSSGTVLAEMSSILPNILANIRPNDMGGGKDPQSALRSALTQQLKGVGGLDETQIQSYVNSVVGKMGEDFTKMLSESGGDYNELAKKLMSNVSDPFLNAFKTITVNLEKAADTYVAGINKLVQATLTTVQEFDKLSKIQQQTRNIRTNIAIEDEVKRQKKARPFSDVNENVIGLNMTNVADQTQAFREQQARLAGVNVNGQQLTPDEIQAKIEQNRARTEQAQTKQNNSKLTATEGRGDYVEATNELGRLKVEASLLNQAMKNLADSTEEISAIEQRVGKIRQEIAKEEQDNARKQSETENKGEKLLTSSPEQLQRLQAGSQLANVAKSIGGNLLRFNVEQRKAIFEYLDFSGDEGKKLKSQFLQASGFVSKPETAMQDKFGPQLAQLNQQLLAVMAVREQAQINIIKDQQTLQGEFFTKLSAQNEVFFTRLGQQLLMPQVAQQQQIQLESNAKLVDMKASEKSVALFNPLDALAIQNKEVGGGQAYYNNKIRPKTKDITSFLLAEEERKKIAELQPGVGKDSTAIAINALAGGNLAAKLPSALAQNKAVQTANIDLGKLSEEIQAANKGGTDSTQLASIITAAIGKRLATLRAEQEQVQGNLAGSLGLKITTDQKGNRDIAKDQDPTKGGVGGFVTDLIKNNVTGAAFTQATEDVKRLGNVIGTQFTAQMGILEAQTTAATTQIAALNIQIAALGKPKPPVPNAQNVNAIAPPQVANPPVAQNNLVRPQGIPFAPARLSTGGMVTHSSAIVGADPKVFKPIGPDTIPAMLNDGEYVVNAKATSENLPLLQALNGGGTVKPTKAMNDGGAVKYLAGGAFVGGPAGAGVAVNAVELKRIIDDERQRRVDLAILQKFGNLRGSWRRNALNNSLRIQAGDSNLTNIPYQGGQFIASAIVSPAFDEPWTPIKDITTAGLKTNNLNPQQKEALNKKAIFGMPLNIKPVHYQWITGITDKYIRGDLTQQQKNTNINANQSVFDVTAKDAQGNSKEYYRRRAKLDPFFQGLLVYGAPVQFGENKKFSDTFGFDLADENFPVLGFSKGGQAGRKTPAMVQSGEFIVGADKAKKNKGLLDHMNGGGKVSYLSLGGMSEADEFMRNSSKPGVQNILQTFRNNDSGPGNLKIKRMDPLNTTGVATRGTEYLLERARHYLGERIANQFSRILSKPAEDVGPDRRVMKKMQMFQDILPTLEKNPEQLESTRGFYNIKRDTAVTLIRGEAGPVQPQSSRKTTRHEFGGHALTYAAEKPGAKLKNSIFGSLGLDTLENLFKPTRTVAETHARIVEEKSPAASLKRMISFLSNQKAANAYGANPILGKDALGFHAQALKDLQGNKGQIPIDGLLSGAGKGKEAELFKEFLTRAGKKTSSISEVAGKSYINAKAFVGAGLLNPKKSIGAGLVAAASLFGSTGKSYGQEAIKAKDSDSIVIPGYESTEEQIKADNDLKAIQANEKFWENAIMAGYIASPFAAVGTVALASRYRTNQKIAGLFPDDVDAQKKYRKGSAADRMIMIKNLKYTEEGKSLVKTYESFIKDTTNKGIVTRNVPFAGFFGRLGKGIGKFGVNTVKGIGNIVGDFNSGELQSNIIKSIGIGKSDEIPMNKAGGVDWGKNIPTNQIEASIKSPDTTPQMRAVLQKILDERAGKPTSEVSTNPVVSETSNNPIKVEKVINDLSNFERNKNVSMKQIKDLNLSDLKKIYENKNLPKKYREQAQTERFNRIVNDKTNNNIAANKQDFVNEFKKLSPLDQNRFVTMYEADQLTAPLDSEIPKPKTNEAKPVVIEKPIKNSTNNNIYEFLKSKKVPENIIKATLKKTSRFLESPIAQPITKKIALDIANDIKTRMVTASQKSTEGKPNELQLSKEKYKADANKFLQNELDARYGERKLISKNGLKPLKLTRETPIPGNVIAEIQSRNPYLLANQIYNARENAATANFRTEGLSVEQIQAKKIEYAKRAAIFRNIKSAEQQRAISLAQAREVIRLENIALQEVEGFKRAEGARKRIENANKEIERQNAAKNKNVIGIKPDGEVKAGKVQVKVEKKVRDVFNIKPDEVKAEKNLGIPKEIPKEIYGLKPDPVKTDITNKTEPSKVPPKVDVTTGNKPNLNDAGKGTVVPTTTEGRTGVQPSKVPPSELVGPLPPTPEQIAAEAAAKAETAKATEAAKAEPAAKNNAPVEAPKTVRQILEKNGVTPSEMAQVQNQFPDIAKGRKINEIMKAVQRVREKNKASFVETNNQLIRANNNSKTIIGNSSKFNMIDGGKTIQKYGTYAQIALPLVKTSIVDYMNGVDPSEIKKKLGAEALTSAALIPLFEGLTRIPKVAPFAGPLGLAFLPQTATDLEKIGTALTTNKNQGQIKSVVENYGTVFPEIANLYDKKKYESSSLILGESDADTTLAGQGASYLGTIAAGALAGSAIPIPGGTLLGGAAGFLIASYKFLRDTYARNLKLRKNDEAKTLRKYLQPRFDARGMGSDNAAFFDDKDDTLYTKLLKENPSLFFNNFSDEIESYGIVTDRRYGDLKNQRYLNENPYTSIEDAILFEKLKDDKGKGERGMPESFISEITPLQKSGASEGQLNKIREKYESKNAATDFILKKLGKGDVEKINDYDKSAIFGRLFKQDKNILNIEELGPKILFDDQNEQKIVEIAKSLGVKMPDDQEYSIKDLNTNYDVFRKNLKLEQLAQNIKTTANLENLEGQTILSASEKLKKQKGGLYVLPIQRRRLDDYINQTYKEVSNLMEPTYTVDGLEGAEPRKIDTDKEKRKNLQKNIENELFNGSYEEDATKTDLLNYVKLMKNINQKKYYKDRNYGVEEIKYAGLLPQYQNIEIEKRQKENALILEQFSKDFGKKLTAIVPFFNNNLFNTKFDALQYSSNDGNVQTKEDFFKYDKDKIKKDLNIPEKEEVVSKNIYDYFEKNKSIKYNWIGAKENNLDQPIAMASGGIVPSSAPNPDPSFFVAKGSDTVPAILSPGEYVVNARATAANLPLLQNLNSGGAVKYLYRGGDLQAINPYYARLSGQSPGRGYINSRGRQRTDFDIGAQGYLASKNFNPRSNANTLNNLANYAADRSGFLNKPGYGRYTYNSFYGPKHSKEFGGDGYGSTSFSGRNAIPDYLGGLNALSDSRYGSPKMAGVTKFALEDWAFEDILNNREISRGPIGGYQMSDVGSRYISGLIGGPPADKVSLKDYMNELGFSKAGNQTFQGVSANKALAMGSLADTPGSNVGIAQQAISSIQTKGLGNLSVNNTDVAAATALDTIKNARMSHYNQPRRFFANGGSTTDTQPAMLTPGEFVVSKPAVDRVGTAFLDRVNNYAKGGKVGYYQNGTGSSNSGSGPILGVDFKILQSASENLQGVAGLVSSAVIQLGTSFGQAAGTITSSMSLIDKVGSLMNSSSSAMYSSSLAFERAVNNLASALDRVPKTINLAIAPLSLNVSFNTPSVLAAIQQSLSGITTNVAGMIRSAIEDNNNDQMRA